jgi:hypothetical protein
MTEAQASAATIVLQTRARVVQSELVRSHRSAAVKDTFLPV